MNAAAIKAGDVVLVNVRGDEFSARVLSRPRPGQRLRIQPMHPGRGWFSCMPANVRRVLERAQGQLL